MKIDSRSKRISAVAAALVLVVALTFWAFPGDTEGPIRDAFFALLAPLAIVLLAVAWTTERKEFSSWMVYLPLVGIPAVWAAVVVIVIWVRNSDSSMIGFFPLVLGALPLTFLLFLLDVLGVVVGIGELHAARKARAAALLGVSVVFNPVTAYLVL